MKRYDKQTEFLYRGYTAIQQLEWMRKREELRKTWETADD